MLKARPSIFKSYKCNKCVYWLRLRYVLGNLNTNFTLGTCIFGAIKLTKHAKKVK